MSSVIFTIGHSTRTIDGLLELLRAFGIGRLVDVRRFPASRRHPQFTKDALAAALAAARIAYEHEPDLGGRRAPLANSPNFAWHNAGFRGYADHAATAAFRAALERVIEHAEGRGATPAMPTALMCAEAVPWRCHRRIIADHLVVRGWDVRHVLGPGRLEPHALSPTARVGEGGRLVYDRASAGQGELFGGVGG